MWLNRRHALLLALLSLQALTAWSTEESQPGHDFEVIIQEAGSLGAGLTGNLRVDNFYRDPSTGKPSRLQSRGVEIGDLLVAVNAVPVDGMSPKDVRILLQAQSRPLRLIFRPHDGRPRVIPGLYAPEAPKSEDDIKAEGHLDVLDGPLSLYSVPVTRAKFGGHAACERKLIVAADPSDACTDPQTEVAGKYVIAERGNCTFAVKALNLGSHGALGMVLVNSEAGRHRMSGEDVESRLGKDFEAPASVMVSKADGDKLKQSLRAHRNHLYGRLVVTEECFRGEDEWHKVHDVAWKAHPHLQPPKPKKGGSSATEIPSRPQVTAKGIRVTPSGPTIKVDLGTSSGSTNRNKVSPRGRSRDDGVAVSGGGSSPKKVVVKEWDRSQGGLGRQAAEWRVRTEEANRARREQNLRSGLIQLRSMNLTYIWDKGAWSDHDAASVAGVASGPVVARADFLPSDFGGPIPLGQHPIVAALPVDDCSRLDPPLPEQGIWVISMANTTCSLTQVIKLAQQFQASLLAITETGRQDPRPRVLHKQDLDSEAQTLVDSSLWVPLVEMGEDEGLHLLEHVRDPTAMVQAEIVDSPEVLELWGILDKLQDAQGWPQDTAQQRRLFHHLKQRHDPEGGGGSVGRYKYLLQGYEKVAGGGYGAAVRVDL